MSTICFLMDHDFDHNIVRGLLHREPIIDILCVGHEDAPAEDSDDPVLLEFAWQKRRLFVSRDKKTMPGHLAARFASGGHTAGVILLKPGWPIGRFVDELLRVWSANAADEWQDRTIYLPN